MTICPPVIPSGDIGISSGFMVFAVSFKRADNIKIAVPLVILTGMILSLTFFFAIAGSYVMQAQMVTGMGLPE